MDRVSRFVHWTPRVLSIFFITFLALMSLDVFSPELSLWQTLTALVLHNIPVFILLAVLAVSWRHEIVGSIAFILGGILYMSLIMRNILASGFEWYYLSWAVQISGMAFFIGIMFLIGWLRKKKYNRAISKA